MGLHWDWTDKMGEVVYDYPDSPEAVNWTCNLYKGNAQMIAVNENKEGLYNLVWFSADKEHLRNMLGLTRGHENCFKDFHIKTIRLNTRYKDVAGIVSDFAKAKLNITIELYYEEEQANG